jgi:hypothetical protein
MGYFWHASLIIPEKSFYHRVRVGRLPIFSAYFPAFNHPCNASNCRPHPPSPQSVVRLLPPWNPAPPVPVLTVPVTPESVRHLPRPTLPVRSVSCVAPTQVDYKEHRNTASEFLTSVCAIVGGVATISGLVQSVVQLIVSSTKSR